MKPLRSKYIAQLLEQTMNETKIRAEHKESRPMEKMDTILKAIPLDDYRIEILAESGVSGIFDVKPYLHGSAFHELRNESYFRTVRPIRGGVGIAWPHEQDFGADRIIWDIQHPKPMIEKA
uniref:DUF2442 domain-containing protein n=1 Tax=Candidatus Kentrum sp. DK TaxID=2126562 RepID=A0A450SUY6_9GAMM|nr:MAG: Protein of unknown function (DUF2442) [Candidatus Kentron sp. DK]